MTNVNCCVILLIQGGGCIYALTILLILLSIFLSYNIISYYFIYKKFKSIFKKANKFKFLNNKVISKYFNKIQEDILNLSNPYGISFKKYVIIKYLLSICVFLIVYLRYNNLILSIIYFFIIFFIPNLLIYLYKRQENIKLTSDIDNICQSLILTISSHVPLYEALNLCSTIIDNKRLKKEFEYFINDYTLYNFDIEKASKHLLQKFDYYEFKNLLEILIQAQSDGNVLESLEYLSKNLKMSYYKVLKYKEIRNSVYVSLATIISVFDIILIVMYPLFSQITQNLNLVFN